MAATTPSIRQSNVKPNSNSVQPTRLRTRVSRANDRIARNDKPGPSDVSISSNEEASDYGSDSNVTTERPAKRKKAQNPKENKQRKISNKKEKEKQKAVDELTTVRNMDDINPAIIDIPRPNGAPFGDAVSPDTLQFMADLAENNEREFMLLHNERWQKTRQDFTDFVDLVMRHMRELDPTILDCQAKEAVYRLK